jgi:hypothetical protein
MLHTLGTALLVTGLGMWWPTWIVAGWAFVALALGLWSWNIGSRIVRAPRARGIAVHVTAAYAALWLTLALAGVRIGNALGWWMVTREPLVAAHVQLAAVGFGGVLVMGLGSRLFPMFLMNRNTSDWPGRWCGPLTMAGVVMQVAGWLGHRTRLVPAGGALTAMGGGLFLVQAIRWVRSRARRALDHPLQQLVGAFPASRGRTGRGIGLTVVARSARDRGVWNSADRRLDHAGDRRCLRPGCCRSSPGSSASARVPGSGAAVPRPPTCCRNGALVSPRRRGSSAPLSWLPGPGRAGHPSRWRERMIFALGSITAAQQYLRLVAPALRGRPA